MERSDFFRLSALKVILMTAAAAAIVQSAGEYIFTPYAPNPWDDILEVLAYCAATLPILYWKMTLDARKQAAAERMLDDSETRFRSLFEHHPDPVIRIGTDGTVLDTNRDREEARDYVGRSIFAFYAPDSREAAIVRFSEALAGKPSSFEATLLSGVGEKYRAVVKFVPIRIDERVTGIYCIAQDLTAREKLLHMLQESRQLYKSLFDYNLDATYSLDREGRFVELNRATCETTGYEREELLGASFEPLIVPEDMAVTKAHFAKGIGGETTNFEISILHKQGHRVLVSVTVVPVVVDGDIPGVIGIARDITEERKLEKRMERLAYYDALTELPNRVLFRNRLEEALEAAQRDGGAPVSVLFVDLDRFKIVNDSLGHGAGDRLIQEAAVRLKSSLREGDSLSRHSGDEFTALLACAKEEDIRRICDRMLAAFRRPFVLEGYDVFVTPSIGIARTVDGANDAETLVRNADRAMYAAKKEGGDAYRFFAPESASFLPILEVESYLRQAIQNEELELVYQPQVCLRTGRPTAIEALIRWNSPALGAVPPDTFIPIAEQSDLIEEIGKWVFRRGCEQLRALRALGYDGLKLSVNVSLRQFRRSDFADFVAALLEESEIEPSSLDLEITERVTMSIHSANDALTRLRKLGVIVSVDDFGTGYSSLSYIKDLLIDRLKIDRSFVKDLPASEKDRAIVTTIIEIGKRLGLAVVAEGVETEEQLRFIRDHGCDEAQGYYIGRPMPADRLQIWLEERIGPGGERVSPGQPS